MPLASEPTRTIEPDRIRDRETWSPMLETELREPVRLLVRPLVSELARPTELGRDV